MNTGPSKLQPVTLTREELYRLVWEMPMIRLGQRFGVSGNGLAKICRRLDVPYPPRGHWARKAAGKKVAALSLPKAKASTPQSVRISPTESKPAFTPTPEIEAALETAKAKVGNIRVAERLQRPHAVIAGWLCEHKRQKGEARIARHSWGGATLRPAEFSDQDRRRHRILDALFKALERQGAPVSQGENGRLLAKSAGEKIEFEMREKPRQIRRPLSEADKGLRSKGSRVGPELPPSGCFVFTIKSELGWALRTA